MYRKPSPQMTIDDFILPFSGKMSAENRWVKLAQIIPWDEIEEKYAFMFPSDRGNVAKPVRMALGALIIQARCGYTDRETVQQIAENPYLQYFLGFKEYQLTRPFTPVAMVKFRKRFSAKKLQEINERILTAEKASKVTKSKDNKPDDDDQDGNTPEDSTPKAEVKNESKKPTVNPNQGTLILDATCAPADINYPTDLGLINAARNHLDEMIDAVHAAMGKPSKRPRTYREKARKDYLMLAKQRKPRKNQIRQAIKKQLQYARRNLKALDRLLEAAEKTGLNCLLSQRQITLLATIRKMLKQQDEMYETRKHSTDSRIVNLYQPHVRPIVRGKAGSAVEFGAKIAISLENGYSRIEKLEWDPYNEATTFIDTVERYKARHGCYPEAVLADRIYRNRENLAYCKDHGIRLSGPKLGKPLSNTNQRKAEKLVERQDAKDRNAVEGKFGEGKRKYGLGRIYARLKETSECVIAMQFLVMNLERRLKDFFSQIFYWLINCNNVGVLASH